MQFKRWGLSLALLALMGAAHAERGEAGEHEGGGRAARSTLLPKMAQECSSCHIAYRPNFLPTSSWMKIMANLDKHFGTDASLADADQKAITDWLRANSQQVGEAPPDNRITRAFWFQRKHGSRHLGADVWSRASIKSPSNCQACHTNADQGNFDEHAVRVPR